MNAIRVENPGGPEALRYEQVPKPEPKADEALVKVAVAGVNFIDVYHRTGHYKLPLPFTPGMEGAGTVEAVGASVSEVKPGDRVGWAMNPGGYAEYAAVPAWKLAPIPPGVDAPTAAALMLQGMTAHFLSHSCYPIQNGDWVLVHAGAGGVGGLLVQMARMRGGRVIATVGSDEKAAEVRALGADEVVVYTKQDFESEAKRITGGKGVAAVYDAVGKTTFEKSMNSLRPRGFLVLYGGASGPVAPVDPLLLSAKGSLYLTRPTLVTYASTREELLQRAAAVLGWAQDGKLKVRIGQVYPLRDAAQAHRDLEGRKTMGKLLLTT